MTIEAYRKRDIAEEKEHKISSLYHKLATEKKLAEKSLKRIEKVTILRQAAFSDDREKVREVLKDIPVNNKIRFQGKATYLFINVRGNKSYRFQMFPVDNSISDEFKEIAFITYILTEYKKFDNPVIVTGENTNFTGSYDGINCLREVTAFIEYKNYKREPTYAKFNLCEKVEGFPRSKK